MMKLFHVITTVPQFRGHRDVELWWFAAKRALPVERPYLELIKDYASAPREDRLCAEEAIDELFDEREASAFIAWLKQNRRETDETTKLQKAELPISSNNIGLSAIPCGGEIDNLMLRDLDEATLGFMAYGFFDLRAHEKTA